MFDILAVTLLIILALVLSFEPDFRNFPVEDRV